MGVTVAEMPLKSQFEQDARDAPMVRIFNELISGG